MDSIGRLAACVCAGALLCASVIAGPFPEKPVRMVVPWPPGGPSDTLARLVMGKAAETLGQVVVIDNRPGASAVIGTEAAAKAAPDGYTLLWVIANHTTNHLLFKVNYDPVKDFTSVGQVALSSYLLVVNPEVPVKSLKEFVEYVKARPGTIAYGSAGNGTLQHLGMEALKREAGLDMVHVPYKGSAPAMTDLLGGQIQAAFEASNTVLAYVRTGRLRALAAATQKRLLHLPNVPTVAESGYPGFEVVGFTGILAPAGTSPAVIGVLNSAVTRALGNSELREKMATMGLEPAASSPEQFSAFLRSEIPKYSKILKESGAKLD